MGAAYQMPLELLARLYRGGKDTRELLGPEGDPLVEWTNLPVHLRRLGILVAVPLTAMCLYLWDKWSKAQSLHRMDADAALMAKLCHEVNFHPSERADVVGGFVLDAWHNHHRSALYVSRERQQMVLALRYDERCCAPYMKEDGLVGGLVSANRDRPVPQPARRGHAADGQRSPVSVAGVHDHGGRGPKDGAPGRRPRPMPMPMPAAADPFPDEDARRLSLAASTGLRRAFGGFAGRPAHERNLQGALLAASCAIRDYPDAFKLHVTGHGLGGALAVEVQVRHRRVRGGHVFNPVAAADDRARRGLLQRLGAAPAAEDRFRDRSRAVHVHHVLLDLRSAGFARGTKITYRPRFPSGRHKLRNFLPAGDPTYESDEYE